MSHTVWFWEDGLSIEPTDDLESRACALAGFYFMEDEDEGDEYDTTVMALKPDTAAALLLAAIKTLKVMRVQIGDVDWDDLLITLGATPTGMTPPMDVAPLRFKFSHVRRQLR